MCFDALVAEGARAHVTLLSRSVCVLLERLASGPHSHALASPFTSQLPLIVHIPATFTRRILGAILTVSRSHRPLSDAFHITLRKLLLSREVGDGRLAAQGFTMLMGEEREEHGALVSAVDTLLRGTLEAGRGEVYLALSQRSVQLPPLSLERLLSALLVRVGRILGIGLERTPIAVSRPVLHLWLSRCIESRSALPRESLSGLFGALSCLVAAHADVHHSLDMMEQSALSLEAASLELLDPISFASLIEGPVSDVKQRKSDNLSNYPWGPVATAACLASSQEGGAHPCRLSSLASFALVLARHAFHSRDVPRALRLLDACAIARMLERSKTGFDGCAGELDQQADDRLPPELALKALEMYADSFESDVDAPLTCTVVMLLQWMDKHSVPCHNLVLRLLALSDGPWCGDRPKLMVGTGLCACDWATQLESVVSSTFRPSLRSNVVDSVDDRIHSSLRRALLVSLSTHIASIASDYNPLEWFHTTQGCPRAQMSVDLASHLSVEADRGISQEVFREYLAVISTCLKECDCSDAKRSVARTYSSLMIDLALPHSISVRIMLQLILSVGGFDLSHIVLRATLGGQRVLDQTADPLKKAVQLVSSSDVLKISRAALVAALVSIESAMVGSAELMDENAVRNVGKACEMLMLVVGRPNPGRRVLSTLLCVIRCGVLLASVMHTCAEDYHWEALDKVVRLSASLRLSDEADDEPDWTSSHSLIQARQALGTQLANLMAKADRSGCEESVVGRLELCIREDAEEAQRVNHAMSLPPAEKRKKLLRGTAMRSSNPYIDHYLQKEESGGMDAFADLEDFIV